MCFVLCTEGPFRDARRLEMNVVDYVIIGVIGLSVLFGIYRGFVASVLNMGG